MARSNPLPLFFTSAGREVDDDPALADVDAHDGERALDAHATLAHRGLGEADELEGGRPARRLDFDAYGVSLETNERGAEGGGEHGVRHGKSEPRAACLARFPCAERPRRTVDEQSAPRPRTHAMTSQLRPPEVRGAIVPRTASSARRSSEISTAIAAACSAGTPSSGARTPSRRGRPARGSSRRRSVRRGARGAAPR